MVLFFVPFSPGRTTPRNHPKIIWCTNRSISDLRRALETYLGSWNVDLSVVSCRHQILDRRNVFVLSAGGFLKLCRFHTISLKTPTSESFKIFRGRWIDSISLLEVHVNTRELKTWKNIAETARLWLWRVFVTLYRKNQQILWNFSLSSRRFEKTKFRWEIRILLKI